MENKHQINLNIWSDYVCPFCYLEEPILNQIKKEYADTIHQEWRAFELRPDPVPVLDPQGEYLKTTWERAVYPMAQMRGMALRLPPVQPRSRKALEAAKFARAKTHFEAMNHEIFRAFFEDGSDLSDINVLLDIGASVGLDRDELRKALETDQYTEHVLKDEKLARDLKITAVPTILISRLDQPLEQAIVLTGAQPYKIIRTNIEHLMYEEASKGTE
ncbi:MAG: 2-hydroxychromene-2-carboxylate isomerase/DsbA-like thioredoxin domain [Candidatus Jettenia ecosi]|uniref:2-hydroxychromene-2-carboxylate isomerase/DsbA-like thioredoxin domain n=1 Tax=Candidatus Jettenia ecosi TaxID=2494326 RepID=A0A533Q616_9BACT|nr:MAG: 2-hydroxychromene-2-carboxylate isomerase/DsbA-like thioredoxin domain [Candidatus Jettenia ecosi]